MVYFKKYSTLCLFCRKTGIDKSKRFKTKVWLNDGLVMAWALPITAAWPKEPTVKE